MMMRHGLLLQLTKGRFHHLDFLTDLEKDVFKTAFELNQNGLLN